MTLLTIFFSAPLQMAGSKQYSYVDHSNMTSSKEANI